jgi:DNA relaxase NicK
MADLLTLPKRIIRSKHFGAFVDYASFSFQAKNEFPTHNGDLIGGLTVDKFVDYLRQVVFECGLNANYKKRSAGLYSYTYSETILITDPYGKEHSAGVLAYSEKKEYIDDRTGEITTYNAGAYLSLTGVGCVGFDFPLFIEKMAFAIPKITRVDIAIDYFDGLVDYQLVEELYKQNAFVSGGRPPRQSEIAPKVLQENGDWLKAGGWTYYVGKRGNSKFLRAYEKGLQLFAISEDDLHPFPDWFRVELELRAENCIIPLECFNDLDAVLMGAYPNFFMKIPYPNGLENPSITDKSLLAILKQIYVRMDEIVSFSHLLFWMRHSYGAVVNILKFDLGFNAEKIVELLLPDDIKRRPKRLVGLVTLEDL